MIEIKVNTKKHKKLIRLIRLRFTIYFKMLRRIDISKPLASLVGEYQKNF